MMSADLLVLLSDIDGLYDKPPSEKGASFVPVVAAHHAGDRGDGGCHRARNCRAAAC